MPRRVRVGSGTADTRSRYQLETAVLYLLGNMIAKYTLAASEYDISVAALEQLLQEGVDLDAVYTRRRFYGKTSPYIYEHAIPASIIRTALLESDGLDATVRSILENAGGVAVLLRDEDILLRKAGLNRKMPKEWKLGDDPWARYSAVGVTLSGSVLRVEGSIQR